MANLAIDTEIGQQAALNRECTELLIKIVGTYVCVYMHVYLLENYSVLCIFALMYITRSIAYVFTE